MIKQISDHHYTADDDTSLKELKEAGWVSSVKLSRREDLWGVQLLKLDIPGLTAAGFDILQIHDELTFIIPQEKLEEAVAFIKDCMEPQPFPAFDLPLVAEASAGPTFGKMEELED